MGGCGSVEQKPPKAWETGAWAGVFVDPYADGVMGAGELASCANSLADLLGDILKGGEASGLSLWDAATKAHLTELQQVVLPITSKLGVFAAKNLKDANALAQLVEGWVEHIQNLPHKGYALIPCGWKDGLGKDTSCVLIVERIAQPGTPEPNPAALDSPSAANAGSAWIRVVLVNAGEGADVYHPGTVNAAPEPKLRCKTALLLGQMPISKVTDPAFLSMLLSQRTAHESHKMEMLYDALLPWLCDKPSLVEPLAAVHEDSAADWRTPARSKTSGWRSLMEACRYMLRRRGVDPGPLKQLSLLLRRAFLTRARKEMRDMADPGAARSPAALRELLMALPLVGKEGARPDGQAALAEKRCIGLYFSAHWCGPCRNFTPRLAETYRALRNSGEMGFEVVFLSRDRDQAGFQEYFDSMPWLALQFGHSAVDTFAEIFKVQGIPTLVLLSPTGEVLNEDGRGAVGADPTGAQFPWAAAADNNAEAAPAAAPESITTSDRIIIGIAGRQLSRAALKEYERGGLQASDLAAIEAEIVEADSMAQRLERACSVGLPPAVSARLAAPWQPLQNFELLCGTGEDQFRGQRVQPPEPKLANMLDLPRRADVDCFQSILTTFAAAVRITDALLARARDTGGGANATSASRLAIQGQVISLIQSLFTEVLPVPLPPAAAAAGGCPWTVHPVNREQQMEGLRNIYKLMHRLGEMWQDIEEPTRLAECVRATAASCAYAMFDVTVRMIATDKPLEISAILTSGGGALEGAQMLSTGVGRMRGLAFEQASERLELFSPSLAHARADAVAYFTAIKASSTGTVFDMPIDHGGEVGLVITLELYGPTCEFLIELLTRCGYERTPQGSRTPTEMDSIMMWFGSHPSMDSPHKQLAAEHPEWMMLRDTCTMFKFLYSMLPVAKENMQVRKEAQDFRGSLPLSFNPGSGRSGGRGESLQNVMWMTATVRGVHHHIADLTAHSFFMRKITWGEGSPIKSPAAVGSLLDKNRPTEEDILHCNASQLKKARFDGTLSAEEAESLMTCLVAPYVRVPLVAHFFADLQKEPTANDALRCGNRASFLFNERLQALFQAALLEQGTWVPEDGKGSVVRVPMRRTERQAEEYRNLLHGDARRTAEAVALGSPFGLLLNELVCSPEGTLRPLIEVLRYTKEVSNCSLHSNSAAFTLFILSLSVITELFGNEAMADIASKGAEVSPMLAELGDLLRGQVLDIIEAWIDEASKEVSTDGKRVGNLPTLCVLHAHRALLYAPAIARGDFSGREAAAFVGSLAYVRGRHCFGQQLVNVELTAEESANPEVVEKKLMDQLKIFLQSMGCDTTTLEPSYLKKFLTGQPVYFVHEGVCIKVPLAGLSERSQGFMAPPSEVPESMLADVLQLVRRPLVEKLEAMLGDELGEMLAEVVCTALGNSHSVASEGWERTPGHPGLYKMSSAGIICDTQAGEILYQSEELRPVPDSMSSFADFEMVFGKEALQCAFKYTHEHRRWVEIVGEEHELLEWDAPAIDAQGIGVPSPLPGVVFKPPGEEAPPPEEVFSALEKLQVKDKDGAVKSALEACGSAQVIGLYFSAHWCPPCRGFTPKLGATYQAVNGQQAGRFEVIFISSDRSEEQFNEYFNSMAWRFAVPYSDGANRQSLGELFKVQGIPSLVLVTVAGHVVSMSGRDKVAEDPAGAKFPWGSLSPPPPPGPNDPPPPDALSYAGVRYNRPFVWYHPGKVFPAPPPDPEPSEKWAVERLQPVLEALFPSCPPDKKMTYVLYMPETPLFEDAEEMTLLGMSDEDKDFATWKEVRVNKTWNVVHCYNLVSHGRRIYRTLVWSSNGAHCLETLKPMHLKPSCCPIPPEILDASGDWKLKRMPDPSLVIVRHNHTIGGRETFLPPRLLAGVVPGAFLDAHQFWQTEDLVIRGYPNNDKDEWFPYALEIKLLEGSSAQVIRCRPDRLSVLQEKVQEAPPALTRLKSLGKSGMLERTTSRVPAGQQPAIAEDSIEAPPQTPAMPVLSRNKSFTSRLTPLLELGFSEEMARNALDASRGPDGRENYDLAVSMLLGEGDMPAAALQNNGAGDAMPATTLRAPPALERGRSAYGGVAGSGKMVSKVRKADAADGELVLMDLFYSRAGSPLHRLAKCLTRVEDLGHILVWGRCSESTAGVPGQVHQIALIEMPRLKLKFQCRKMPDGSVKVFSLDHTDWFLSDLDIGSAWEEPSSCPPRTQLLANLLQHIPHSLLLENATKELQLLVPAWELRRPKEKGAPFGTHLIFNRGSEEWANVFSNTRCFLYPVHATRTFLMPKTLDAQLYLILLRFYGRQYTAAHRWATSIAVDVSFAGPEFWVFRQFRHVKDGHPDAHALRMRLLIAIRFSPDADRLDGWEAHEEFDAYLRKQPHVTAGCALTPLEELQAIRMLKDLTPSIKIRKAALEAYNKGAPTVPLAAPAPLVGGEPWNKMACTSKELFEGREWLTRFKFKIPAEDGGTELVDAEALNPIFENLLLEDDESGNTRQLGFLFLYALAIGQIKVTVGGRSCGASMSQILARAMQLKLAHWGKRAADSELEAKLSKSSAILAFAFDFPTADWPRLPLPGSDEPAPGAAANPEAIMLNFRRSRFTGEEIEGAMKQLQEGTTITAMVDFPEEEQSEEDKKKSAGQMALWDWHVDLKDTVRKILDVNMCTVNRESRRHVFKTRREAAEVWICAPHEVTLAALPAKLTPPFVPSDLGCSSRDIRPFERSASDAPPGAPVPEGVDLSLSPADVRQFAAMPLRSAAGAKLEETPPKDGEPMVAHLPFPIGQHPAASASIAKDMLARLEADLGVYKTSLRDTRDVRLLSLEHADLKEICAGAADRIAAAISTLEELGSSLDHDYEVGMKYVENAVHMVVDWARHIPESGVPAENLDRCKFRLKQRGGLVLELQYEALVMMSMSTKALEDLASFNPFLPHGSDMLEMVIATELHANRIAQNARTATATVSLRKEIGAIQNAGGANPAQYVKLPHSVSGVVTQLGARRYCLQLKGADDGVIDPRLLAFEFLSSFLLRERQVQMVQGLKQRALNGQSSCQQMIMGAGKTTVVGPLLVLCLADGATSVLQTMPSALLEMTRNVLREVFAYPLPKQVFTLTFDRTQDEVGPVRAITEKLELAMSRRGVVVAAPEAIKSLTLKMVEMLHSLDAHGGVTRAQALGTESGLGARERLDELEMMVHRSELADACSRVLALWRQGVVIMDEVDVLLHPLRSELNFPIGDKVPVDLSGDRWELPLFLIDLIFIDELEVKLARETAVESKEWHDAESRAGESRADVAKVFRGVLEKGISTFGFMTLPHLVLMDSQFYLDELAVVVARFSMLWVHRLCPDDLTAVAPNATFIEYLTGKAVIPADAVAQLKPESMKRLNLAADWVLSFMPHCLSRVNRVAYGLLSKNDKQPASAPESRRLMAVPFLAKDVPSLNSEFAHPDVVIGLTILAYRHEGLRMEDLHRIVKGLKADFARQIGPRNGRPANVLFETFREEGREAWVRLNPNKDVPSYLNLELFQPEDNGQMIHLHRLLTKRPQIVQYYLTRMVFPDTMNFHRLKVSACGHELGSDMIFARRIGFSGTPSNLLPEDLRPCMYEPGSDGKIIEVLTDPAIVSSEDVPTGWTARSLLAQVAAAEPPFHALIDTGALVTGLESVEVAQFLLEELPEWFQGVVYLDKSDRQMVLLRTSGRSAPLKQCGLPLDRRFTFYDQIHTTGMDIKQAPNARAALTIGKDMVFRDYAQGAWRMRGIGVGQTISLMIIPEVQKRIQQDLELVQGLFVSGQWEANVPSWLLINSMRSEGLQEVQLNLQELHNVYRKKALQVLAEDAAQAAADESPEVRSARFAAADLRARKLKAAIEVFRERISNELATDVPQPKSLRETFDEYVTKYDELGAKELLGVGHVESVRLEIVRARTAGGSNENTKAVRGGLEQTREQQQEKEQEQQQMKEREQEEEQMNQFCRDEEGPNPWPVGVLMQSPSNRVESSFIAARDAGTDFPFSTLVVGDDAFFPMALLHAVATQPQLPFPRNILMSANYFRPRWAGLGDRRLKNISLVVEWQCPDGRRLMLVPSLAEAETIRRLIHNGEYGLYDAEGLNIDKKPLAAGIAVRTLGGHLLDSSAAFSPEPAGGVEMLSALQCLRFFHGDMFFSDSELALLMTSLAASPPNDRRLFFEECIRRRRRERREWSDTPIARIFVEEAEWATLKPRAFVESVRANVVATLGFVSKLTKEREKLEEVATGHLLAGEEDQAEKAQTRIAEIMVELSKYPKDIAAVFAMFDLDLDQVLNRTEFLNFFKGFNVHPTSSDMPGILEVLSAESTGIASAAFCEVFEFREDDSKEIEVVPNQPWVCPRCPGGMVNVWENHTCVYCQVERRPDLVPIIGQISNVPQGKWRCAICTFHNADEVFFCDMCGSNKDAAPQGGDFD